MGTQAHSDQVIQQLGSQVIRKTGIQACRQMGEKVYFITRIIESRKTIGIQFDLAIISTGNRPRISEREYANEEGN